MDRIEEALEYVFREGYKAACEHEPMEEDSPLCLDTFSAHVTCPDAWDRIQYEARRILGDD